MLFHLTKLLISINLGILSVGLSLANVGAQNVIMLAMPRQNSGISLGLTTLLRIVGSSLSPAVAAIFMQEHQYTINIQGRMQSFRRMKHTISYFLLLPYSQ